MGAGKGTFDCGATRKPGQGYCAIDLQISIAKRKKA
jgi:hypothetical protein